MRPRAHVGALLVAAVLASAGLAAGQERPTVFVHGLMSSPDTWAGAADRLSGQLAIEPHVPGVSWNASYEQQANELQAGLWWLPASTIGIGHSNGGVAVRQWSRHRPLGGIVTLGSPNQGAPIVGNLGRRWCPPRRSCAS